MTPHIDIYEATPHCPFCNYGMPWGPSGHPADCPNRPRPRDEQPPPASVTARAIPCPYGQDGERVCCGSPTACQGPRRGAVSLLDEALEGSV